MGKVKKYQYVKENIAHLKRLHKSGDLPTKIIKDYQIYQVYKSYSHIKSRMERIEYTAMDTKVSWMSVRRAIKNMEKLI